MPVSVSPVVVLVYRTAAISRMIETLQAEITFIDKAHELGILNDREHSMLTSDLMADLENLKLKRQSLTTVKP